MTVLSYCRHRFPPAVIEHAVWLYLRFSLLSGRRGATGRARS
jgi:transposase-like protein